MEVEPVFPVINGSKHYGLSLRDYFAGQALTALSGNGHATDDAIVKACYSLADAMLDARKNVDDD